MARRPSPLKVRREAAGLTQEELAAKVGVSPSQIYRIEAGKSGTTRAVWNMIDVVLGAPTPAKPTPEQARAA